MLRKISNSFLILSNGTSRCTTGLCQRTGFFFGDLNKLVVHQENSFKSILSVNPPQATLITTIFFWNWVPSSSSTPTLMWNSRQVSCRKKTSLTVSRGDVLVHQEDSLRLIIWDHSRRQPPHRYFDFSCFYSFSYSFSCSYSHFKKSPCNF